MLSLIRCTLKKNIIQHSRQISHYQINNKYLGQLQGVILDWSGTTADKYVIAPAVVFKDVFEKFNVPISMEEARLPMGLRKDLHIEALTKLEDINTRWNEQYGRPPNNDDVDNMFREFVPMQLACLKQYSGLLPETVRVVNTLRDTYNLKIGMTTGFTREMVDILLAEAQEQGFIPDVNVAGDEVQNGARPGPHMVYRNMDLLNITNIHSVVKVDDTVGGVGEGLNAGCWAVGIARYSNYMNINTYEEEEDLGQDEIERRLELSRTKLKEAGAHYVIDTLDELLYVIDDINENLSNGITPNDLISGTHYTK